MKQQYGVRKIYLKQYIADNKTKTISSSYEEC